MSIVRKDVFNQIVANPASPPPPTAREGAPLWPVMKAYVMIVTGVAMRSSSMLVAALLCACESKRVAPSLVTDASTEASPVADSSSNSGSTSHDGAAIFDSSSASVAPFLYGVTVDDISSLDAIVTAVAALPKKPTTRIVFEQGQSPGTYTQAVKSIHAVSYVMGEILDSQFVKDVSTMQYSNRTSDYLAAFPTDVDIWEVGNEINGSWLGPAPEVAAKMSGAYDLVKAAGGRAALTLYGCSDAGPTFDMFEWTAANVPPRMATGLDYVLVSYYEGDCGSPRHDWPAVFARLRQMFPTAGLGFGEVGATDSGGERIVDPTIAGPYLRNYYGMQMSTPGYVGGYFWWYFAEDMVPKSKPMFSILRDAIQTLP